MRKKKGKGEKLRSKETFNMRKNKASFRIKLRNWLTWTLKHVKTFTNIHTFPGAGSLMSLPSFDSKECTARGLGRISGEGAKISCPLSSRVFASDSCFFIFASVSLSKVPLSSRCFATSVNETGFLGETLSSALNEIWLIALAACRHLRAWTHQVWFQKTCKCAQYSVVFCAHTNIYWVLLKLSSKSQLSDRNEP